MIWNKGLTAKTDKRVAKYGKTQSLTKKKLYADNKLIIWNKNLTKETDERVKRIGTKYPKDRKKPTLTKRQIQFKTRMFSGKNNPNYNPHKTKFQKYKIKCNFDFKFKDFPLEFDISKVRNMFHPILNRHGYTRDHKLSINDGFLMNIPPELIKHPANCAIISHSANSRKNIHSSINIEQLIKMILKWEERYSYK